MLFLAFLVRLCIRALGDWVTGVFTYNRLWFWVQRNHNRLYAGGPVTQPPSASSAGTSSPIRTAGSSTSAQGACLVEYAVPGALPVVPPASARGGPVMALEHHPYAVDGQVDREHQGYAKGADGLIRV